MREPHELEPKLLGVGMFLFRGLLLFSFVVAFSAQANVTDGQRAYEAENYIVAFSIFQKSAINGDPQGQFYLGECYFNGRGVPQDFTLAVKWLSLIHI